MDLNEFAIKVTLEEGKKRDISIAQIKEVLKIINKFLDGKLYSLVRKMK